VGYGEEPKNISPKDAKAPRKTHVIPDLACPLWGSGIQSLY